MSSREQFISMGEEVRDLKQEVQFLVTSLQNSMRHKEILQRKLDYFEQKEEDELIKMSLEHDEEHNDSRQKNYRYSSHSTALTPYSCNYTFSHNFRR